MIKSFKLLLLALVSCLSLNQCATNPSSTGTLLGGPSPEQRAMDIATEPSGDYFYGRRYFVEKTRFWGYLRQPRQPWSQAKLVIFKEDRKHAPDRLPEFSPNGYQYGYDNNYEYKITGHYTGETGYDPNSNQFLPIFRITGYQLVNRNPGWIFRPDDRYNRYRITLYPH